MENPSPPTGEVVNGEISLWRAGLRYCVDSKLLLIVKMCQDTITKTRVFLARFLTRVVNVLYTLQSCKRKQILQGILQGGEISAKTASYTRRAGSLPYEHHLRRLPLRNIIVLR